LPAVCDGPPWAHQPSLSLRCGGGSAGGQQCEMTPNDATATDTDLLGDSCPGAVRFERCGWRACAGRWARLARAMAHSAAAANRPLAALTSCPRTVAGCSNERPRTAQDNASDNGGALAGPRLIRGHSALVGEGLLLQAPSLPLDSVRSLVSRAVSVGALVWCRWRES